MNIAVFIKNTTFHKHYGGFETQNKVLCEGLVKNGHKVTVFSPKKEINQSSRLQNGVTYVFVSCVVLKKFNFFKKNSSDGWLNRSFEDFSTMHKHTPFDLVLSQSSGGLGMVYAKEKHNVPIISISHGTKMGEFNTVLKSAKSLKALVRVAIDIPHVLRAFFITQRDFIHGSQKVIAVSSAVKMALIDETFVDADKVVVINNGIDASALKFSEQKQTNDQTNIIYVGRILKEKGIFLLLAVFKKLVASGKIKNTKLHFVGDGVDLQKLKNSVQKAKLQDAVKFYGNIPYEQVLKTLQLADIFVLPTMRVEGFPMVLVEALFSKLAVIATDMGGNEDAIITEETGLLIAPNDKLMLSESIEELVNNKELRNKLAQQGFEYAQNNFTLQKMIEKYEQVFASVLN